MSWWQNKVSTQLQAPFVTKQATCAGRCIQITKWGLKKTLLKNQYHGCHGDKTRWREFQVIFLWIPSINAEGFHLYNDLCHRYHRSFGHERSQFLCLSQPPVRGVEGVSIGGLPSAQFSTETIDQILSLRWYQPVLTEWMSWRISSHDTGYTMHITYMIITHNM